jgi:drug/metabolite transporter (DMT)-like permease
MAETSIQAKGNWLPVAGLLLLSFLWALDSLRSDLFPHSFASIGTSQQTTLGNEAASFLLLAIAAALFSAARKAPWPRGPQLWSAIAIGIGLFAAPAELVSLSATWVSATTRVAIFSLVPVFAIVLSPHLGSEAEPSSTSALIGALAAVAGTLCIFPLQLPSSISSTAAIAALLFAAACIAAANCFAVRLARAAQTGSPAPLVAVATSAAAAALVFAGMFIHSAPLSLTAFLSQPFWSALLPLPALLILFWLMPRMTAARMTTRFVLAPFLAVLIGIAFEQPSVGLRIWIGLLLVAAGAGWLLFAPAEMSDADSLSINL